MLWILAAVVAGLCCIGGVIGGVRLLGAARSAVGDARAAADAYLRDVQSGDVNGAYDRLCASTRSHMSRDAFVAATRPLRSYEITAVHVTEANGRTSAMVSTHLTLTDGTVTNQILPLIKEGGAWRICDTGSS